MWGGELWPKKVNNTLWYSGSFYSTFYLTIAGKSLQSVHNGPAKCVREYFRSTVAEQWSRKNTSEVTKNEYRLTLEYRRVNSELIFLTAKTVISNYLLCIHAYAFIID